MVPPATPLAPYGLPPQQQQHGRRLVPPHRSPAAMCLKVSAVPNVPVVVTSPLGVPPALPPGWQAKLTREGRLFYVNHATQSTQWDPPVSPMSLPLGYAFNPTSSSARSPSDASSLASAPSPWLAPSPSASTLNTEHARKSLADSFQRVGASPRGVTVARPLLRCWPRPLDIVAVSPAAMARMMPRVGHCHVRDLPLTEGDTANRATGVTLGVTVSGTRSASASAACTSSPVTDAQSVSGERRASISSVSSASLVLTPYWPAPVGTQTRPRRPRRRSAVAVAAAKAAAAAAAALAAHPPPPPPPLVSVLAPSILPTPTISPTISAPSIAPSPHAAASTPAPTRVRRKPQKRTAAARNPVSSKKPSAPSDTAVTPLLEMTGDSAVPLPLPLPPPPPAPTTSPSATVPLPVPLATAMDASRAQRQNETASLPAVPPSPVALARLLGEDLLPLDSPPSKRRVRYDAHHSWADSTPLSDAFYADNAINYGDDLAAFERGLVF